MNDTARVEAFWQERVARINAAVIPVAQNLLPLHANSFSTTWRVEWTLHEGETVYAVLSVPTAPGPHPALLLIPPYGSAAHVASYELRRQYITLTLRHRGMRLTRSQVQADFPGFLTAGIEKVATYGFTRVVEDCVLGAQFLAGLAACGNRPLVCRGHELSLLTAALVPAITHVACRIGMWLRLSATVPGTTAYPLAEINDYLRLYPERAAQVWDTLSYFDPQFMVHRVQAAVLLITGGHADLHTPAMGQALLAAMATPPAQQELYPSRHSSFLDERHVLTWMARCCHVGDPDLPAQWT